MGSTAAGARTSTLIEDCFLGNSLTCCAQCRPSSQLLSRRRTSAPGASPGPWPGWRDQGSLRMSPGGQERPLAHSRSLSPCPQGSLSSSSLTDARACEHEAFISDCPSWLRAWAHITEGWATASAAFSDDHLLTSSWTLPSTLDSSRHETVAKRSLLRTCTSVSVPAYRVNLFPFVMATCDSAVKKTW